MNTQPKPLTKDQQIVNCLLALSLWKKVKPANVELSDWRCGTHACFGGHLATWRDFQAMGVRVCGWTGAPELPGVSTVFPARVAEYLFGNSLMFTARGYQNPDDGPQFQRVSDHEIVVRRLEAQIARLSEGA